MQTWSVLTAGLLTCNLVPAQTASWTGSGADQNWSTIGNWTATVPDGSTGVVFTNNAGAATAAGTVDNIVDSGFPGSIASLQFANTNTSGGAGFYHTTQIGAGQTLTVLGDLRVGYSVDVPNSQISAAFTGAGTLVLSNATAGINVSQGDNGNGASATLNLTNLNTLNATIGGITVGTYNTPNYSVARQKGYLYLAQTNVINCVGNAPRAYGNESQIEIGENLGNGSNLQVPMYLGIMNTINVDSITVGGDKQGSGALLAFNPAFTNDAPVAVFRGTNGPSSRVSRWTLADNSNQSTTGSGTAGTVDFSNGSLDAMIDTLTLGVSEKAGVSGKSSDTGTFTFSAGTNDVNTLYVGYGLGNTGTSVGNGTMNVNGTGTLIANDAICLSHWTAPDTAYGTANLNINDSATVLAATITNGVTDPGSIGYVNANITMNGGTLGITSLLGSIGTTAWPLGTITLSDSTLDLPVSGLQTNVVSVVLNLNGDTNIINITSLPASVTNYPTQIPLMAYQQLSGFNIGVSNLPGTYQGYISNNTTTSTIDLVLTHGPTNIVTYVWQGSVNGNWDTTSLNWLGGVTPEKYYEGVAALFDDTATGATNINLTAVHSPAYVRVNNNLLSYSFSGAGIDGAGGLIKDGTGSLLFTNSGNTFAGSVVINAGSVQFGNGGTSGNLPATGNVLDNGSLIFNRSGNVTLPNTISGTGTFTKNGTSVLTVTGSNDFSGTAIVNAGTMVVDGVLSGTLANATGSTVGGSGTNAGSVTVNGAIQPSAATGLYGTFTTGGLTLAAGATPVFGMAGGSNDMLQVNGDLALNNNVLSLSFSDVPQTGTPYTLINYTGSKSGSFSSTVAGTHYTAALNQSSSPITVTLSGTGANLKWNCPTNNGLWDAGISSNWLNTGSSASDVFDTGDNVVFDDSSSSTNLAIPAGTAVTPASIVVNASANNFTITGGGGISGSGNLVKSGSGTLILGTPNNLFTGAVSIQGGTLQAGNNSALVAATTTVANGGTLDINGYAYVNGPQTLTVSGAGAGGFGALVNDGADQQNAFQNIALAGNTSIGGAGRLDIRQSGANPCTLTSADGNPYDLTVLGPGHFNLVSVTVDQNLGNVDIKGGAFGLQVNTLVNSGGWAGDTTKTITVESNGMLSFYNVSTTVPLSRAIVLSNNATLYDENGQAAIGGLVTLQGIAIVQVDKSGTAPSLTLNNVVSGPGGLIKTGAAPLVLTAVNTYTGNTLVNAGTLQLGPGGDGAIASSPSIIVAANATLDASQRSDQTLTLASGQTLQGGGAINGILIVSPGATLSAGTNASNTGVLTCSNNVTLQGSVLMKLNPAASTNDVISVVNGGSLSLGGILTVTNVSGASFAVGNSFHLFNAATYSGNFTTVVPATPGPGLAWDTNSLPSGILNVVAGATPPQPHITSISLSGTSLIINGTNGLAGESYNVLTSTNVALPLAGWTVLPAGTFNAASFSVTNPVTSSSPQSYYMLRVP